MAMRQLAGATALLLGTACGGSQQPARDPAPADVTVAEPEPQEAEPDRAASDDAPPPDDVPIHLPKASDFQRPTPEEDVLAAPSSPRLSVEIAADGTHALDGVPVSDADLEPKLRQHCGTDSAAVISADGRVAYGKVVHTLDLLKRAGCTKISLAVQRP